MDDEKSVAKKHSNEIITNFAVCINDNHQKLRTFTDYLNFINGLTKLVSLQTLAHVQLRVCQKSYTFPYCCI